MHSHNDKEKEIEHKSNSDSRRVESNNDDWRRVIGQAPNNNGVAFSNTHPFFSYPRQTGQSTSSSASSSTSTPSSFIIDTATLLTPRLPNRSKSSSNRSKSLFLNLDQGDSDDDFDFEHPKAKELNGDIENNNPTRFHRTPADEGIVRVEDPLGGEVILTIHDHDDDTGSPLLGGSGGAGGSGAPRGAWLEWAHETTFRRVVCKPFIAGGDYIRRHPFAGLLAILTASPIALNAFCMITRSDPSKLVETIQSMSPGQFAFSVMNALSSLSINTVMNAEFIPNAFSAITEVMKSCCKSYSGFLANNASLVTGASVFIVGLALGYGSWAFMPGLLGQFGFAGSIAGESIAFMFGVFNALVSFASRYVSLQRIIKRVQDLFNEDVKTQKHASDLLHRIKKELLPELNEFLQGQSLNETGIKNLFEHLHHFQELILWLKKILEERSHNMATAIFIHSSLLNTINAKNEFFADDSVEQRIEREHRAAIAQFFVDNYFKGLTTKEGFVEEHCTFDDTIAHPLDKRRKQKELNGRKNKELDGFYKTLELLTANESIFNDKSYFEFFANNAGLFFDIAFATASSLLVFPTFAQKGFDGVNIIFKRFFWDLISVDTVYKQGIGFLPGAASSIFYWNNLFDLRTTLIDLFWDIKAAPSHAIHSLIIILLSFFSGTGMHNLATNIIDNPNNSLPFPLTETNKLAYVWSHYGVGVSINAKVALRGYLSHAPEESLPPSSPTFDDMETYMRKNPLSTDTIAGLRRNGLFSDLAQQPDEENQLDAVNDEEGEYIPMTQYSPQNNTFG